MCARSNVCAYCGLKRNSSNVEFMRIRKVRSIRGRREKGIVKAGVKLVWPCVGDSGRSLGVTNAIGFGIGCCVLLLTRHI